MGTRPDPPAIGANVIHLRETSSTVDHARKLLHQGALHGTVVLADEQTAARGRRGRGWHTLPGKSLAATVILRNLPDPAHVGMAGMVGALAVVSATSKLLSIRLSTKWPNDVVHGGRKLAGTLAQKTSTALLLSIGLNVNGTEVDLPADIRASATTLQMILGRPLHCRELTDRVLAELDGRWNQLRSRPDETARRWEELDVTRGAHVRIAEANGACVQGRALGIDGSGQLRVETPDGIVKVLSADDVTLL